MRAEFLGDSWFFVNPDNAGRNVKFDQALIDPTWIGRGVVEGHVKSVFGIDVEDIQGMSVKQQQLMGIHATPRLGPGSLKRVRLSANGAIEEDA